jgi:hypothetical protein
MARGVARSPSPLNKGFASDVVKSGGSAGSGASVSNTGIATNVLKPGKYLHERCALLLETNAHNP